MNDNNMNGNDKSYQEDLLLQRRKQAYLQKKAKKAVRKRRLIKTLIFIVVFVLVFAFYENGFSFDFSKFKFDFKGINFDFFKGKDKDNDKNVKVNQLDGKLISYIPIDDRDIHTTRIIYLAESGGYQLEMPDSKYYQTHIDKGENSYTGFNTKYGNPEKLASWLLEQEEAGCDYYVISLDQLFSGGLLGSTYLSDKDMEVYDNDAVTKAKKAFGKIISDQNNHVYLIDSVVGLTVVPGFMDINANDSVLLTQYSSLARKSLTGEDLTIKKIKENYSLNVDGSAMQTALDAKKLNKYLDARERKLKLSDFIIDRISKSKNKSNVHLFIGIDGAISTSNIMANDISYIKNIAAEKKVDGIVRVGVSSLSEEIFSDMVLDAAPEKLNVKVNFYGGKDLAVAGSGETYAQFMTNLLSDLDIGVVTDKPDFEILVYSRTDDPAARVANTNNLLNKYLSNITNHIPTVIINDADYSQDRVLIDKLSNYDASKVPMGYLIGYSNWNGFIHSSRIGVCEGVVRYVYLTGSKKDSKNDKGFLKVMGESFVEDMGYLPMPNKNYNNQKDIETALVNMTTRVDRNFTSANYISSIDPYEENGIRSFNTYHYVFPWSRVNEVSFDVSISLGEAKSPQIPTAVK